jgi:four helix bundle protein
MTLVKRFEDVQAWQEARDLTRLIYELTDSGLFHRDYALTDQTRRATVSVMNNIVEGFESSSRREFARFLSYAKRSASEVQCCLYVALDQTYCTSEQFQQAHAQADRVKLLITGFIGYLRRPRPDLRNDMSTQILRNLGT